MKMKLKVITKAVLGVVIMISSLGCASADIRAVRKKAMRTYTYKTTDELEIKVDVYPQPKDGKAKPVIMWIHGGALIKGNRNPMAHDDFWDLVWEKGYVIASFDYRLAPETKLPGIVEDLRDGYKWLREKGPELFEADSERIATAGDSAGGYLTRLTGYHFVPRPKAMVSLYGYGNIIGDWYSKPDPFYCRTKPVITKEQAYRGIGKTETTGHDLAEGRSDFYYYCRQNGLWPQAVLNVDPHKYPEKFKPFLPIENITPQYPPIFLAHSPTDTDVPYSESLNMTVELKKAGVDFEFVTVTGGHSFKTADKKELDSLFKKMTAFVELHLKDKKN